MSHGLCSSCSIFCREIIVNIIIASNYSVTRDAMSTGIASSSEIRPGTSASIRQLPRTGSSIQRRHPWIAGVSPGPRRGENTSGQKNAELMVSSAESNAQSRSECGGAVENGPKNGSCSLANACST